MKLALIFAAAAIAIGSPGAGQIPSAPVAYDNATYIKVCGGRLFPLCNAVQGPNAFTQLDQATDWALQTKKLVILDFGADWCGPCHELNTALEKPEVVKKFSARFVTVKISTDTTSSKRLTNQYGLDFDIIPYFAVLDPSTHRILGSFCPMAYRNTDEIFLKLVKITFMH